MKSSILQPVVERSRLLCGIVGAVFGHFCGGILGGIYANAEVARLTKLAQADGDVLHGPGLEPFFYLSGAFIGTTLGICLGVALGSLAVRKYLAEQTA